MRQRRADRPWRRLGDAVLPHAARLDRGAARRPGGQGHTAGAGRPVGADPVSASASDRAPRRTSGGSVPPRRPRQLRPGHRSADVGGSGALCRRRAGRRRHRRCGAELCRGAGRHRRGRRAAGRGTGAGGLGLCLWRARRRHDASGADRAGRFDSGRDHRDRPDPGQALPRPRAQGARTMAGGQLPRHRHAPARRCSRSAAAAPKLSLAPDRLATTAPGPPVARLLQGDIGRATCLAG